MSPKQITRLAVITGGISMVALIVFLIAGLTIWWAVAGLGLSFLLIVVSFLRGAYLTAQKRVDMVDMLNDCYNSTQEADSRSH